MNTYHNVIKEIRLLWRDRRMESCAELDTFIGARTAISFNPPGNKRDPDEGIKYDADAAKLDTMAISVLHIIAHSVEGEVPDNVIDAIGRLVAGAYGLGNRRGKEKLDENDDVKPFRRRLEELEAAVLKHKE